MKMLTDGVLENEILQKAYVCAFVDLLKLIKLEGECKCVKIKLKDVTK